MCDYHQHLSLSPPASHQFSLHQTVHTRPRQSVLSSRPPHTNRMSSAVDMEPPPQPPSGHQFTATNTRLPAPPLPPPLLPPPPLTPSASGAAADSVFDSADHRWAAAHPDVHKACFLARVCADSAPAACRLLDIPAQLQEGPTCGLTAAAMLTLGRVTPEQLLLDARQRGFTRNGEI